MHNNAPEWWLVVWIRRVPGLSGSHFNADSVKHHLSSGRHVPMTPEAPPLTIHNLMAPAVNHTVAPGKTGGAVPVTWENKFSSESSSEMSWRKQVISWVHTSVVNVPVLVRGEKV